jgi:hypothetical protein
VVLDAERARQIPGEICLERAARPGRLRRDQRVRLPYHLSQIEGDRLLLARPGHAEFARRLWPEAKMAAQSKVATVWLLE